MKKSLLILFSLSLSLFLFAQETKKQKEVGLVFSNLNNFGLTYKIGTDKSLWRFNTLIISGGNWNVTDGRDSSDVSNSSIGFGLKMGKEYRKAIAENLELRYGSDLLFSYYKWKSVSDYNYSRSSENSTNEVGMNFVFGFNYLLSDNFIIGAEVLPKVSYTTTIYKETNYYYGGEEYKQVTSGFHYGLSNSSVLLTLAYRF